MIFTMDEVQQCLNNYYAKYKKKISFLDALNILLRTQEPHENDNEPDFLSWNVNDLDEFAELSSQIPIPYLAGDRIEQKKFNKSKNGTTMIENVYDISIVKEAYNVMPEMYYINGYKLFFVMRGKCKVRIENGELELTEGEGCMISPLQLHGHEMDEEDIVVTICFNEEIILNNLSPFMESGGRIAAFLGSTQFDKKHGYCRFSVRPANEIRECYKLLFNKTFADKNQGILMKLYLNMLLFEIQNNIHEFSQHYCIKTKENTSNIIYYIASYIRMNCDSVTLNELSQVFSYEKTYISHKIVSVTGKTFSELVKKFRIEKAKLLLLGTDKTVEEIGINVGYNSRNNFYKAFESELGCSPAQFRKINNNI